MSILKIRCKNKDGDKENYRHLGALLPQELTSFITLYTYAHSVSRTTVLTNLLLEWMESLEEEDQEAALIEKVVQRSINAWKALKVKNPVAQIKSFKEQLIYELEWKGLSVDIIKKILKGFNDGTV